MASNAYLSFPGNDAGPAYADLTEQDEHPKVTEARMHLDNQDPESARQALSEIGRRGEPVTEADRQRAEKLNDALKGYQMKVEASGARAASSGTKNYLANKEVLDRESPYAPAGTDAESGLPLPQDPSTRAALQKGSMNPIMASVAANEWRQQHASDENALAARGRALQPPPAGPSAGPKHLGDAPAGSPSRTVDRSQVPQAAPIDTSLQPAAPGTSVSAELPQPPTIRLHDHEGARGMPEDPRAAAEDEVAQDELRRAQKADARGEGLDALARQMDHAAALIRHDQFTTKMPERNPHEAADAVFRQQTLKNQQTAEKRATTELGMAQDKAAMEKAQFAHAMKMRAEEDDPTSPASVAARAALQGMGVGQTILSAYAKAGRDPNSLSAFEIKKRFPALKDLIDADTKRQDIAAQNAMHRDIANNSLAEKRMEYGGHMAEIALKRDLMLGDRAAQSDFGGLTEEMPGHDPMHSGITPQVHQNLSKVLSGAETQNKAIDRMQAILDANGGALPMWGPDLNEFRSLWTNALTNVNQMKSLQRLNAIEHQDFKTAAGEEPGTLMDYVKTHGPAPVKDYNRTLGTMRKIVHEEANSALAPHRLKISGAHFGGETPSAPVGNAGPNGASVVQNGVTYHWNPQTQKYE